MIICIPKWGMYRKKTTDKKNEEENIECHQDIE